MARLPRFFLPDQPQHVIIRGNNRGEIFRAEADYRFYLEKLHLACEKHHCHVHAYVLMTNHVHLLVSPQEESSLAKTIQMVGRYYVQHYNYRYQRTGTLWEGRYKATLIDTETYLFTCMRYIELNPVRAGIVTHPSRYPWSSYARNVEGQNNELITPHLEYRRLGATERERQTAYRQLFKTHLSEKIVNEIREAINKAWVLGDNRFKRRIQKQMDRRVEPIIRGGDRKSEQFRINRV